MKIGSFDTSSLTAPLSQAVEQVEAKVESTVSTVKETVVQAEQMIGFSASFSPVPEPSSLILCLAAGLAGMIAYAWRRRR